VSRLEPAQRPLADDPDLRAAPERGRRAEDARGGKIGMQDGDAPLLEDRAKSRKNRTASRRRGKNLDGWRESPL
jgi:hypothetical protein